MPNLEESVVRSLPPHLITSGSVKLAKLLASLVAARKGFDPSASDHGRMGIYQALLSIIGYVSEVIPQRPDLVQPLRELLYGLRDLDRGTVVPLLEPASISHRPRISYSAELFRADAAILMDLKRQAGVERKIAGDIVARRLNKLGYRDKGESITGKQVVAWRNKVSETAGSDDLGAGRYVRTLKRLEAAFPNNPEGAFVYYLGCMADLDIPTIPKKDS